MTDRSSRLTGFAGRKELWLRRALLKPIWTIVALGLVTLTIEVCQQWPEFFFPGHAIGEVVRNLAYALIGAVLFNWILIEIPAGRRRRIAYQQHFLALQFLVQAGPLMLAWYRLAAKKLELEGQTLDSWSRGSLETFVRAIYHERPANFGAERQQTLTTVIQGIQLSLDGLDAATYFLDPDVAAALAHFPAAKGINQLQPPEANDQEPWKRDVHIAWEHLEASRRLHEALQSCAPDVNVEVEKGVVSFLNYSPIENVRLDDLVPAS